MAAPTATPAATNLPREGQMATVRNRRALISQVKPFDTRDGRLHLVELEYTDTEGALTDSVVWEREVGAKAHEPGALPNVHDSLPMVPARTFDALVRASRWSALTPFLPADGSEGIAELPVSSPFHAAVQVEDFQLVPLLKALQMPRISLLLADDVGLGKTVEAGLILSELLLRRRIRRVLVLTPASLRDQWQQEMLEKFSLSFDVVDRQETHQLRKQLGLDANPWRTFPRVITSYHYLRQHDVLEQFMAACRQPEGAAQLPWDLLIVDEAHNLMPSSFGDDSDLTKMLRVLSPLFEHKLFLTATPHNGHTRSFSGLLELLDPVRFHQTAEFTGAEKERVAQVVIRRLKREINENDKEEGRTGRFCERDLEPLPLFFGKRERALSEAFAEFRSKVHSAIAARHSRSEQLAGSFAVEVLNKRLLSSPVTFGDSWLRFMDGMNAEEKADTTELEAARNSNNEDIDDDLEKEGRARYAAHTAGAWLKPLAEKLAPQIEALSSRLGDLGIRREDDKQTSPREDARFDRLVKLIDSKLRKEKSWRDDERLIVFTEYKTTLDDLERRLRAHYGDGAAGAPDSGKSIRVLFGGMDPVKRKAIRIAFNDPLDPVRVLIATDAASEGLNLQETARYLLHYEIPWNPSRLEQRNGRLDRHGQPRDVTVYHFTSEDDADLKFLARVVGKVHQIREDLGSVGEVFDAAFQRRFVDLEDSDLTAIELDAEVDRRRGNAEIPASDDPGRLKADTTRITQLRKDIDLDADTLRATLEVALGYDSNTQPPHLEGPDGEGRFRLKAPFPPRWQSLIDDSLRLPDDIGRGLAGAIPNVVFDPEWFVQDINGRPVFRPRKDTALLHLGHPVFRYALGNFARLRFPTDSETKESASRWTVSRGSVPSGADAVIALSLEELAVNTLREPFHHWVRTVLLPVRKGVLAQPLPYEAPSLFHRGEYIKRDDPEKAQEIWGEVESDLKAFVRSRQAELQMRIAAGLGAARSDALQSTMSSMDVRIEEVRKSLQKREIEKVKKERDAILKDKAQGKLFAQDARDLEQRLASVEEEIERRESQARDMLKLLEHERKRVVEQLIPQRFSLTGGGVQVLPLAVEIRLPEVT